MGDSGVVEAHPATHEYIYARAKFFKSVADKLLDRDGEIAKKQDDGSVILTFRHYAATRKEARELVTAIQAVSDEFKYILKDLEKFIDEYESDKWPD